MIFIGCDGGSTKTEWLLCNERGRVLAHRTFSGCNCAFLGEDGFARLMADSAESLLADAGPEVRNYFEPPFEDTRKHTNLW